MLIKISISTKSPAKHAGRRNNVQNINDDFIALGDVYDGRNDKLLGENLFNPKTIETYKQIFPSK